MRFKVISKFYKRIGFFFNISLFVTRKYYYKPENVCYFHTTETDSIIVLSK